MAANDYTRTVNITPLGTSYSWDTPPSWITINQVGTSNDWIITVAANSGTSRSATLTVRHSNTTTTDTISVSQAGGTVITPTATPASPTATPVVPTATPVVPTPAFTFATNTTSGNRFVFTPQTFSTDVAYTIVADGETSPVAPSDFNTEGVDGTNVFGPTVTIDPNVFNGTYRFTKTFSPINNTNVDCTVIAPYGTSDTWYCVLESDSGEIMGPTSEEIINPTPTPFPTATTYVDTGGGGTGGGGCHLAGDLLTLANGETKKVEDIVLGDALLSLAINGLSDVETIYREFNISAADYSDEYTSAVVNDIYVDTYSSYYDINNGELQLTLEHPVLVKTSDDIVVFKVIKDVLVGDSMLNQNNEWVLVNSNVLVQTEAPFTTYAFNVENKDVYFASGILVHNVMDEDVLGKDDGFNGIQE